MLKDTKNQTAADFDRYLSDLDEKSTQSAYQDCTMRNAAAQRFAAEQWIENNPGAWNRMVDLALEEVDHERPFSVQYLVEEVRRKDHASGDGGSSRISNTMRPAITRLLLEKHPETRPYIKIRHALCDCAF